MGIHQSVWSIFRSRHQISERQQLSFLIKSFSFLYFQPSLGLCFIRITSNNSRFRSLFFFQFFSKRAEPADKMLQCWWMNSTLTTWLSLMTGQRCCQSSPQWTEQDCSRGGTQSSTWDAAQRLHGAAWHGSRLLSIYKFTLLVTNSLLTSCRLDQRGSHSFLL